MRKINKAQRALDDSTSETESVTSADEAGGKTPTGDKSTAETIAEASPVDHEETAQLVGLGVVINTQTSEGIPVANINGGGAEAAATAAVLAVGADKEVSSRWEAFTNDDAGSITQRLLDTPAPAWD